MKNGRILLLSLLCVLAFSSCKKDYSEFIVGTWELDKENSYEISNNKRHYYDDIIQEMDNSD